jgi:uncharacterized protein (DUF608 family)
VGSQACQGAPVSLQSLEQNILEGGFPLDVPGLGIPVGGVGAGSFMINQDGTFGPWNFGGSQDATWENRILPQAAVHFREQVGSSPATVTTLATDGPNAVGTDGPVATRSWGSPLSGWNLLQPGQGTYSALYPFGWETYTAFKTNVSIMFYSPIVAGQDVPTSLPLVYFDVKLANNTGKNDNVSMMFTMPNAPDHTTGTPASVRQGYTSTFENDPRTGVQAVTLGADSPSNTPDAANSSWTIAAKPASGQHVSYTTSWNANGNGSDVYAPFTQTGALSDQPLDNTDSAGAIAVSANLAPGQTTTIPFALTWDFPQVGFDNNQTVWMRRYTDFFGAREDSQNNYIPSSYPGDQSFSIANDALALQTFGLADVEHWYTPIADNPAYPVAVRTAALNQLYQLVFNDSFWEGGLVSNTVQPTAGQRLGSQAPGTHLFDTADSAVPWSDDSDYVFVNNANEYDVDSYGYLAYDLLFPNLERDRILALSEATMLDPNGDPGQIYVASSTSDPFITWSESSPPSPGTTGFVDIPSKNIYRDYAYAELHHDTGFLQAAYPAMQKELTYLQGLVPPGSYLPESPYLFANTYDVIPVNQYDVYDTSLYILALEATLAAGQQLGENPNSLAPLYNGLSQAKAQFETVFWDPVHQAYRYTPGPTTTDDTVMLDTFFAENVAEQLGLPDVLNPQHMQAQLANYYSSFEKAVDPSGNLLGAPNMILPSGVSTYPYVGPFGTVEETEVWTGTNYEVASTYINAGKRFRDPALVDDGVTMASAISNQVWQTPSNGFAFDAPEAWHQNTTSLYRYPAYARPLAAWDDLESIRPLQQPPQTR